MEESKKSSLLAKSISGIMLCTLAYKFLGFVREIVLSYYFGTSGISDAYLISQQIPSVIFEFIGAGISTCFIPIFFKVLHNKDRNGAFEFTNKITTLTLCFSTIVIMLVMAFAPFVVKAFASGFTGETLWYASAFTRICILSLYFSSFVFIYGAFLEANNKFIPNYLSAVVLSLCVLLSIILGAKVSVWIMSIGSCLAVGIRLFFIVPASHKVGLRSKLNFHWRDENVKTFFILMIPVVLGTSVNEINTLVDRTIASQIAIGGISALTYANSMLQLATGGIVQPFSTVVYPQITDSVHRGNKQSAVELMSRMLSVLFLFLIPITVGICFFSKPVISLLFARGAFDDQALIMTSDAFKFYSIALCFIGLREMLSKFYYACEDTKTPMINTSIGLLINLILNLSLSRLIGLKGLALATSISSIVTAILLVVCIKRKLNVSNLHIDFYEVLKMIIASIIMGFASFNLFKFIFNESIFGLLVSVLFAVCLYLLLSFVFKVKSIKEARQVVNRLMRKKNNIE